MVPQELDIRRKHASQLDVILLHEGENYVLLLNLEIVGVFQSRSLLRRCVNFDFTTDSAALQVKNALNSVSVAEL